MRKTVQRLEGMHGGWEEKEWYECIFRVIKPTTQKKMYSPGYVAQYKYICSTFIFNLTLLLTLEKERIYNCYSYEMI